MATKKTKEPQPELVIQNCSFTGLEWDKSAIDSLNNIVNGVIQVTDVVFVAAETLKIAAEQFQKLDVKFDALLSVNRDNIKIANSIFTSLPNGTAIESKNIK